MNDMFCSVCRTKLALGDGTKVSGSGYLLQGVFW